MARDEQQIAIDANEAETTERYQRQRELLALVAEAARRADAMGRLEASLRYTATR